MKRGTSEPGQNPKISPALLTWLNVFITWTLGERQNVGCNALFMLSLAVKAMGWG